MLGAMQQDPKPVIEHDPWTDGWHRKRWFWVAFWTIFFPAFIYCLFPAKREPRITPAAAARSQPAATKQPAKTTPELPTPIADVARDIPPTAVLQGEIVIDGPVRTAVRPVAPAGPGATTTK